MRTKYDRRLPKDSKVCTTACQFCAVGCGYRALLVAANATPSKKDSSQIAPAFVTPSMRNTIRFKGKEYEAAVVPDARCDLNRGNHSVRGGSQGLNLVTQHGEDRSTKERLLSPQVRCSDGKLHDIPWEIATKLVAWLTAKTVKLQWDTDKNRKRVLRAYTPESLGVKLYEYQYLENTYAATKLFFRAIGTPNLAYHDRPSAAGSSPGLSDAGFRPHDFAYEDVRHAEVIFAVGSNPYENQSVFFMQNCTGKEMIVLDPRCTATAQYAKDTGGIHLQPKNLGADSLVLYAIARALLEVLPEEALHSQIARHISDADKKQMAEKGGGDNHRRASRALGLQEFRKWLGVGDPSKRDYSLAHAAEVSGIPLADLEQAVKRLAYRPNGATGHPIVSVLYEKGLIWGFNYHNTAAVASLGLVLWRPEQPAPLTGRCGGHQKGWALAKAQVEDFKPKNEDAEKDTGYPFGHATDYYSDEKLEMLRDVLDDDEKFDGRIKVIHNLDTHVFGPDPVMNPRPVPGKSGRVKLANNVETVAEPDVQLLWIIGGNYLGQTNNAQWKLDKLKKRLCGGNANRKRPLLPAVNDIKNVNKLMKIFSDRLKDDVGLVVIHQEIYPNATTELVDIVLPAAGWGEDDFIRYNAERRLRLYERFQDSPLHEVDAKKFAGKDPHQNLNKFVHSPKPDWLIFKDVATEIINIVSGSSRAAKGGRREFHWTDSSAIADEMAEHSNREGMIGPVLKFGEDYCIPKGRKRVHTVLGLGGKGESKWLKSKYYSVPNGSPVLSNGVASNGVMLPAKFVATMGKENQGKLEGTLRNTPSDSCNFVKADWGEIEDWFDKIQPGKNKKGERIEVALTCGRVNHLWNNMYSSRRNEYISERYPEDMPGTILEVNPTWAKNKKLKNGDIVDVYNGSKKDRHFFVAIISLQDAIAEGAAFAIFSYPVFDKKKKAFTFDGFVNNVMHGYWDGMNPIGALKYARARVKKRKLVDGVGRYKSKSRRGPVYAQRNKITALPVSPDMRSGIDNDGRWSYNRRLDWRMRELIVAKGLPRAFVHSGEYRQATLLDPDKMLHEMRNHWGSVFSMMLDAMQWPPPDRDGKKSKNTDSVGRYDRWDGKDLEFVREVWGRSLEIDSLPPHADSVDDDLLTAFIAWSVHLTGFDDLEKDRKHAHSLLVRLRAREGFTRRVDTLLGELKLIGCVLHPDSIELVERDAELAEQATILWYTGTFLDEFGFATGGDEGFGTMRDDHYRKALLWRAAKLQPQGYSTRMEEWEDKPPEDES